MDVHYIPVPLMLLFYSNYDDGEMLYNCSQLSIVFCLHVLSHLNWKSNLVCMCVQWRRHHPRPNLYLSLSFCLWHTRTPQGYLPQIACFSQMAFVRLSSCGNWRLTWWRVDAIINNDCHKFQLSVDWAASHNGARRRWKHKHMLALLDSDLWPIYLQHAGAWAKNTAQAHKRM